MSKLGKHKAGTFCLYLKRFSDVDLAVLRELIHLGYEHMKRTYPT